MFVGYQIDDDSFQKLFEKVEFLFSKNPKNYHEFVSMSDNALKFVGLTKIKIFRKENHKNLQVVDSHVM